MMKPPIAVNSLFRPMHSLFAGQNSLFRSGWEFTCNTLELLRELTSAGARMAGNSSNSLLFSLFAGNSRVKAADRDPDRLESGDPRVALC